MAQGVRKERSHVRGLLFVPRAPLTYPWTEQGEGSVVQILEMRLDILEKAMKAMQGEVTEIKAELKVIKLQGGNAKEGGKMVIMGA